MKRLFLTAVSIASLTGAMAAPAFAQDEPPPPPPAYGSAPGPGMGDHMDRMDHRGGEWPLDRRIDWLARRVDRASDAGWLSGNEIGRGQTELQAIKREEARLVDRDGGQLSPEDRTYLIHRVDELNRTLRWSGDNPPPPWAMG